MVTLQNAENALKTLYLDVVSEQLNTNINPLLARIQKSTENVWGKEVVKLAPFGLNGGVGAGSETDDLPVAGGNKYAQFKLTLKNLYGTIELSDKAIRASQNNAGAFVNLLNAEMEGLLKASKFNLGRMLHGDGTGIIAIISAVSGKNVTLNKSINVMEGMTVDFYNSSEKITTAGPNRIVSVNRSTNVITMENTPTGAQAGYALTMQNSYMNEITGFKSIFTNYGSIYGLDKTNYKWLIPYIQTDAGEISDMMLQKAVDKMDEDAGSSVDFIICSSGVKRAYQSYLSAYKQNIDVLNLEGGYKAMSFNGIPLLSDRFVDSGTMYLINSKDFVLHQLCDWSWLEGDDGRVLKQIPNKPVYRATLVKYADLLCERPFGQAVIKGITEE